MKTEYNFDADSILPLEESMAHPLVDLLRSRGVDVQPAYAGYSQIFVGLMFIHGMLRFTIQLTRNNELVFSMLERVGNFRGLRSTWRDMEWFMNLLRDEKPSGIDILMGKVKKFTNGPEYSSVESLRNFYTRFGNAKTLGWERGAEWLYLKLQDYISPEDRRANK